MVAAAYAHSYKAALYEFYKSEYLFLVGRSAAGFIPLSVDEIEPAGDKWYHRVIHAINKDYTRKQIKFTTRTQKDRARMRELSETKSEEFVSLYSKMNAKMLFWWAWLGGSNTHRNAMVISVLFGRFDIYLAASLVWTIGYLPLNNMQRKYDQKLLNELTN